MPDISLLIHTASTDNFMAGQGIPSYFVALIENLNQQKHDSFELVYTDTFHEENRATFHWVIKTAKFPVKHVAIHREHRYWFDQGLCYISAAKNTGILYADGELCITCDDAEFFPDQLFKQYWWHYKNQGRYMHALHKRMKRIDVENNVPKMPISGDFYVNDHRWDRLHGRPCNVHRYGTLLFAGTSFSLEDALQLNGFNERMDGCKGLEDCDFGCRMHWLGRSFAVDRDGWLAIVDHPNYSDIVETGPDGQQHAMPLVTRKKIDNLIAVENHGMLRCGVEIPEPRANCQPLGKAHWDIIQRETLKYRGFDPLAPENADKLEIWKQTPMFDLRKQREELRHSPEWAVLNVKRST